MKYTFIGILCLIFFAGCASKSVDLEISGKYKVAAILDVNKVIKSGDFVAVIGKNNSKLAITENLGLAFDPNRNYESRRFFETLFKENEDADTKLGSDIREFRVGLEIEGYIEKKKNEKNQSTVYLWKMRNGKIVAIVNDETRGYFLNIIGENISAEKILNIIN